MGQWGAFLQFLVDMVHFGKGGGLTPSPPPLDPPPSPPHAHVVRVGGHVSPPFVSRGEGGGCWRCFGHCFMAFGAPSPFWSPARTWTVAHPHQRPFQYRTCSSVLLSTAGITLVKNG